MKAALVERPGVLTVRNVPAPEAGDYDVLCELLYGATCTGTDQHIIHGRMPWPIHYPVILGHESVGRAVKLGPRVRHFRQGDLITRVGAPPAADGAYDVAWGGFAEFGIAKDHRAMQEDGLPEEAWNGFRVNQALPFGFDPAASTLIITWRETLSYLTRMGVGQGAAVLVIGSGGNGLAFVAHARNLGARGIVLVGSPGRFEAARAAGASACFDYHMPDEDLAAAIAAEIPDGFDFIIDAVGKAGQADRVMPLLKPGGAIGIYGIDDFHAAAIHPRRAQGTFTCYQGGYDEAEAHERVVAFVAAGKLDASIWLGNGPAFPLEGVCEAFQALQERRLVKALIELTCSGT